MDVARKYWLGKCREAGAFLLDGNTPLEHAVLVTFQKVVDGTGDPYVFRMIADEDVRSVLDDDDYEIWRKAKAAASS